VSRRVGWGDNAVATVRKARLLGFDPATYVVALGFPDIHRWPANHSPILTADGIVGLIQPLLAEIGADRTVAFFNLYATNRMPATAFNEALRRLTATWPNLYIVDWASLARQHRGWHISDGYHFNSVGAKRRQQFIAQAMVDATERTALRKFWQQ
jgi:hypothetical protein